eukprot:350862-Prorocentrum_minimum.AAC.3
MANPRSLVPCEPNCESSRGAKSVICRNEVPSMLIVLTGSWLTRGVGIKSPCFDVPRSSPASTPLLDLLTAAFWSPVRRLRGWIRLSTSACCAGAPA